MIKQKKRARCNNWRECTSVHCKHKHKHFVGSDCLEECDEPGYVDCEVVNVRKKNSGNKIRENNKTIQYRYVSDLDTKYSFPGGS
jgi:hypothetical protein